MVAVSLVVASHPLQPSPLAMVKQPSSLSYNSSKWSTLKYSSFFVLQGNTSHPTFLADRLLQLQQQLQQQQKLKQHDQEQHGSSLLSEESGSGALSDSSPAPTAIASSSLSTSASPDSPSFSKSTSSQSSTAFPQQRKMQSMTLSQGRVKVGAAYRIVTNSFPIAKSM
jgi:hypothetical protein